MRRQLSHELEVSVPASEVWEVYGSFKLATLLYELLPSVLEKVVVEGDGGVGTVLTVTFPPGGYYKKKCTKFDNEKRMKETEVIEGLYLQLGFREFRVRYEIIEKDAVSSIIKSTIEYEIDEEFASNAHSYVNMKPFEVMAKLIGNYLIKKNANASNS